MSVAYPQPAGADVRLPAGHHQSRRGQPPGDRRHRHDAEPAQHDRAGSRRRHRDRNACSTPSRTCRGPSTCGCCGAKCRGCSTPASRCELGKLRTVANDNPGGEVDLTIFSCGICTEEAMRATQALRQRGVAIRHLHVSTHKPLDCRSRAGGRRHGPAGRDHHGKSRHHRRPGQRRGRGDRRGGHCQAAGADRAPRHVRAWGQPSLLDEGIWTGRLGPGPRNRKTAPRQVRHLRKRSGRGPHRSRS